MKKIILVSIIALNLSALAQNEMPAVTAENPAELGTIQKTDRAIEEKIEKDFKPSKKHKRPHGKKHKKLIS